MGWRTKPSPDSTRIIARHRHEWLRALLGGWGGVASVGCGVVRVCGAGRARVRADTSAYASSTCTDTGSAGRRSSGGHETGIRRASNPFERDGTSDHQRFCPAFAAASQAERNPTPSRAGARTYAAVALRDWRSQCGRGNPGRAANGEPDGHFRGEPQLSACGGAR